MAVIVCIIQGRVMKIIVNFGSEETTIVRSTCFKAIAQSPGKVGL